MTRHRWFPAAIVALVACAAYAPTIGNYFVQDDFGVVALLASKPWFFFPRWFVMPWTENIWGYVPDEVRPLPALSYQLAGIFGAASPVANHLINIAFHAANSLLVLGIARVAAGLGSVPALFAALVFALLPMQSESVAWITGRVDSMPACFYLAAFYVYARWRADGRRSQYLWALVFCFCALFSKQNTITLGPALVLYDLIVGRRQLRASWGWLRPYVPFALMTAGYLGLRYLLFGEVAREGMLTAERLGYSFQDLSTHLRRMVFGERGLAIPIARAAGYIGAAVAAIVAVGLIPRDGDRARIVRAALYFSVVWMVLGVAPTFVAGYASPRHMYLASAGWAITLGLALEVIWEARPVRMMRRVGVAVAALVLVTYGVQLAGEVRLWRVRSEVSRRAVADVEREALAAPAGTLIVAGAPRRSWDFALPHGIRPPFTREDVTARVEVISHSSLHCCPEPLWEAHTRDALRTWVADPRHPPVIALYWDPSTGAVSRLSDRDEPLLRLVMSEWLRIQDPAALDEAILAMFDKLVAGRRTG